VGISGLLYALLAVGLALMDTPDELMNCIGGQGHLLLEAPLTSDTCPELTSQCLALHGDQAYNIAFVVAFKKQGRGPYHVPCADNALRQWKRTLP